MSSGRACQEFLLQGSVLDESVNLLLHRLRGMSDNSEDSVSSFKDLEMVYFMREPNNTGVVNIRVRRSLLASDINQPWKICYLGLPELGDRNSPTTVRTRIEVNCTPNVCAFLQELGFRLEYEYLSQGWRFRKNKLRATVSKIYKLANPPNLEPSIPVTRSHLVEVSVVAGSSEEVKIFSEQLKPLINLEKKDPRRPEMMI